ncbi:MAG: hypothetical protein CMJ75_20535 [Planctomycetaceae bacterium]|nr:hypothetical protein [Planctomycetaceae bacterium]
MKPLQTIGCPVFFIGLVISICAAAKQPAEGATYPSTWLTFLAFSTLSLVGLVLWRWKPQLPQEPSPAAATSQRPQIDIQATLSGLLQRVDSISQQQAFTSLETIDTLMQEHVQPLGEARQQIIDQLGLKAGAELLVTMAYGERMYNRTWSALADGHLDEAQQVFHDGTEAFREAARSLA